MKKFKFYYTQKYFLGRFLQTIVLLLGCLGTLNAQTLTISNTGGTSPNNWSFTSFGTLTVTGNANIRASVIENALANGSLIIEGNSSSFSVTQTEAISFTQSGSNLRIGSNANTGGYINLSANISINGNISVFGRNIYANANLTSSAGNILLDADRGSQQSFNGRGVNVEKNREITANNGSITILGRGGNSGSHQFGISITDGAKLNTTSGNITLTGIGGASSSNSNHGLELGNGVTPVPQINTSGGNITITGTAQGTGSSNDNDNINIRGINIFSGSGSITLNGGLAHRNSSTQITSLSESFSMFHNCVFGHATNQSGPITIIGELFFNNDNDTRQILTSGSVVIEPPGNSFATTFNYRNFTVSAGSFRIGKTTNTANIDLNVALSVAGPIDILGGIVTINANLTSSANGDILIKGIATNNPSISVNSGRTISKSAGTGTLTLQGHSRVTNFGTISATGTGLLNVVMWSDFDNSNNDGGVTHGGTITSNGGHVWMGGSNSNGGSYTWNGLTVGDGPSRGSTNYNTNALDLTGSITTSTGNVFIWAGYGPNLSGIATNNTGTINAGSGNITIKSNITAGTFNLTTTGTVSLVPNGGSYGAAITLAGSVSSGNLIFNTSPYNDLRINNINSVGGLTIGRNEEHLSGGNPVVFGNTSNLTITATGLNVAGPINVYAGQITLSSAIQTSNTTTGNVLLEGTSLSGAGNIALAAGRTATINVSSTSTYNGIISGAGSGLTKEGSGLLTLTNDHTYTGSTAITGGDLQVGTGGSVSQASSGTISSTSGVTVSNGTNLILTPNENIIFAAPISGAGGVEIKGASGAFYNSFLTGTAATIATNSTVLEVMTRITGGMQQGTAVPGSLASGAYQKVYNAANNTATLQFQQFEGTFTKCVFAQLTQSGTNVQIRANTAVYNTGAAYRSGNTLGVDMATGSTSMTLATSPSASGYGVSNVYMSGKVNFTGNLTYSGNTILSNTVTSVTSPNTYAYTSKGTQEITDASTSFPAASTVVNNGLVILNRTTPLTIASSMQGTEDVLQIGAAITLTGTNTHTGTTIVDLNKSLIIGDGSTSGSMTGNIINFGTLTFNRSNNSAYAGIISGSGTLTKLGEGSHTLTGLNTYTGATTISAGKLILERNVPATSSSGFSGTGHLVIQPSSASFSNAITYPIAGFTVASSIGGLTIGKPGNAANITFSSATSIAGPIEVYGGNININENLNTSAGTTSGHVLLKGSADVILAASKSITTSGAPVILWANSDNEATNGSIALRNGSSIVTGSGSVAGGHVWIGGGSNGTTWNGLAVGNGYAVPGTSFTPSNGGGTLQSGIYLERNSISSFGGNIKIAGDGAATARGIVTYGNTVAINAGSGKIDIDGQVTSSAAGNRGGVLFGLHDNTVISTINISSSATTGDAITINGVGRGTEDAIALSGTLNITSSGGGNIVLNGNALGSGRSIVAGNYYNGILNVFASSGTITLNGNTKAVQVDAAVLNGFTSGPSKLNIGQGGAITSSSSDIFITADNIAMAAGGIAINASGKVTIEPFSNSFASALTFPIANLTMANTVSGLTLGKPTNTANITIGTTTTISGPVSLYGGTIAINGNLTATNSNITLSASTAITQTAGIAANGLALIGPGTVTLNHASNAINILAGGTTNAQIGALSYTNNKALTIGSVNPTGIYSSGDIYLATTNGGNINLNHPLNTTSTSADAIRLFADLGQTAGTGTGGQILVNGGSVSVGSGGYAKLFSGNEASSFGLNELTAGSSFRKYNFATATSNDNTALGIATAGTYAIYRDTEYKLTNLTVGAGTLAPTFVSDVFSYSVSLSTTTSSFTFTPTANAGTIHISKNGGTFASHTSGTAYTDNSPDPVSTRYVIQVRDGSGVVKSSYTLHLLVNQSTVPNASAWESSWIPVFQAANFDPNNDQQATAETDLVGNELNPMLMAQQRTVSVGNAVQKVYYFRTRLGNTGSPKTSAYFGLDVNKDLKVDLVVQADLKARTPYVSFHIADPRKDGSGPSQTAWLNSSNNSNIERRLSNTASVITNYPVSITANARGSNGVTTLDLDSPVGGQNTGTDTWLEFAFTETSFQSFTNDALGTARSGSNVNGIVYFTSTSQTANGDIAGIDDRTADLSKTWAELGIVLESSFGAMTSDEVDPPVVVVQSTSSLNGNGTIYGTWNGLQICNTSPGSSLTVTVNGQSFYYNVSGQTNTITLINGGGWSLNFTGFAPGTYTVQAFIENSCTGQTGNGTGTLLISEVLVNDLVTTETKPTLTGRSSLNNQQVRIRIYNNSNTLLGERMVTTSSTGTWVLDLDTTNITALSPANYYVEAYQVNGTSTAIDTGSLTVLQDIYPEIAISSVQLNSSNTYVVSGTSSYRARTGESLTIEIAGPSSASTPTVYTYTIGSSSGITINSTTGAWSVDFAAMNTSDLGLYEVTATINYDIHQTGADVRTASDFATFEALTLLPVALTSFDLSCQEQLLVMSWTTSQELNNAYFTIKESADGKSWSSLAQIPSLGNAFHTQSYSWETASANRAMFFELSQTDIDGQEKILSQRMVNCNSNTSQGFNLQVYPNPNNGSFTIALNQKIEVSFEVLDVLGQTITSGSVNGQTTIQNLAKGLYFVKVIFNGQTWTEKVIVH